MKMPNAVDTPEEPAELVLPERITELEEKLRRKEVAFLEDLPNKNFAEQEKDIRTLEACHDKLVEGNKPTDVETILSVYLYYYLLARANHYMWERACCIQRKYGTRTDEKKKTAADEAKRYLKKAKRFHAAHQNLLDARSYQIKYDDRVSLDILQAELDRIDDEGNKKELHRPWEQDAPKNISLATIKADRFNTGR